MVFTTATSELELKNSRRLSLLIEYSAQSGKLEELRRSIDSFDPTTC